MRQQITSTFTILFAFALITPSPAALADGPEMTPYAIDWSKTSESLVDMSGYLDAPAGYPSLSPLPAKTR